MKKLVLAAACAAIVGGVSASELAYDFTATLKTTTGRTGKVTKTTYTVNLGQDDDGNWWHDTEWGAALVSAGYIKRNKNGTYANGPKWRELSDFDKAAIADNAGFNPATRTTDFNVKSQNKWCFTFKFAKASTDSCYRTASSRKVTMRFFVSDCCASDWVADDGTTLSFIMLNRFGSNKIASATKIEAFASLGGDIATGTDPDQFSLAGQGTWNNKLYTESDKTSYGGVTMISGSIVGVLEPSSCESCCASPEPAVAWDCSAEFDSDSDGSLLTPAYGTWTLKFNKSASNID